MRLTPHLGFGGQCEAAFHFYQRCLGGKIETMLTCGNSPMTADVSPEWKDKICHATLTVGAYQIMGDDQPPEKYERPRGFEILIGVDDPAEAERVFQALSENGTVHMPMQETFWAVRFGVVLDQFGVTWSVNCEQAPAG